MEQFKSKPMVSKQDLLCWSGVPRSSFYYKRGDGLRGRKPSMMTVTQDGELVENTVVLKDVETILQQEFSCYGYKNLWVELKDKGYIINHKKVYRLMTLHDLLFNRSIGSTGVCSLQEDQARKTAGTPLYGHQVYPHPRSPTQCTASGSD
jgi:hypothetical protein